MNLKTLLFIIIFIEGYAVLASELLAMRLVVPWVGSGTEIIAIIIAAVLMPLAFGYYFGGQYMGICKKNSKYCSVRKKLLSNLKISVVILTIGLSYIMIEMFFAILSKIGVGNRLIQTSIYASIFLIYPVFLLGQTIPLISNYFSKASLSEMTGKMLMISTLGSFGGSVISTVVFMSIFGVHNTAIFVILLLCILVFIINKKTWKENYLFAIAILALAIYLNSPQQMKISNIVANNSYNTVQVIDIKDSTKIMSLNGNFSSSFKKGEGGIYNYVKYIEGNFIKPIMDKKQKPKDILVIGAAGFTVGWKDKHNNYTFIDIDPDLKEVAEKNFLEEKISQNKKFVPIAARGFLRQAINNNKKFDLIIMDVMAGGLNIPEHLLTYEYFQQVKKVSKEGGFIVMNIVTAGNFDNEFAIRLDNTLRLVYPHMNRVPLHGIKDNFNFWASAKNKEGLFTANVIYSYHNNPKADKDKKIYTDNKNTYFIDKY